MWWHMTREFFTPFFYAAFPFKGAAALLCASSPTHLKHLTPPQSRAHAGDTRDEEQSPSKHILLNKELTSRTALTQIISSPCAVFETASKLRLAIPFMASNATHFSGIREWERGWAQSCRCSIRVALRSFWHSDTLRFQAGSNKLLPTSQFMKAFSFLINAQTSSWEWIIYQNTALFWPEMGWSTRLSLSWSTVLALWAPAEEWHKQSQLIPAFKEPQPGLTLLYPTGVAHYKWP